MTLTFAKFKALTRFEQSLFGLPFILTSIILGLHHNHFQINDIVSLLLIIPSFLSARISGMAFNQLIDRHIDAKNPRTNMRPIPSQLVTPKQALIVATSFLALFLLFTWLIAPLIFLLSLCAAFLIVIYSYMKRIHYSCHLVLGAIHFLAPLIAYVVVTHKFDISAIMLGCIALCSITGVEIIYSLQDLEFDRHENLKSIPIRFGIKNSLLMAKGFHSLALLSIIVLGLVEDLPLFFYGSVLICVWSFYQLYKFKNRNAPFTFSCNIIVSCSIFIFTTSAKLWPVLLSG